MKRIILILLIGVCYLHSYGQKTGKVFDNLGFFSEILGQEVKYSVYLPDGYEDSTESYPALYLLHGHGNNFTSWLRLGRLRETADSCMANGSAFRMVIIMPEAGVSWYINDATGKVRYEDMFFNELIPCMEKTYRLYADKQHRAIAGLSMGGYGALLYALKYPDKFAVCCPLSAGVFTDRGITAMSVEQYKKLLSPFDQVSENRLTEHWYRNSTLELIAQMPASQKQAVRFYMDCGDDDFLYEGNSTLHILMRSKNIPHEFRIRDGKHSWDYWKTALPEVLKFIGKCFETS